MNVRKCLIDGICVVLSKCLGADKAAALCQSNKHAALTRGLRTGGEQGAIVWRLITSCPALNMFLGGTQGTSGAAMYWPMDVPRAEVMVTGGYRLDMLSHKEHMAL